MQNVRGTLATLVDGVVHRPESWLRREDEAEAGNGSATTHSNTTRLGRHLKTRDYHPGDIAQQNDWSLHVREVEVRRAVVAIAVSDFGFQLRYATDAQVALAV